MRAVNQFLSSYFALSFRQRQKNRQLKITPLSTAAEIHRRVEYLFAFGTLAGGSSSTGVKVMLGVTGFLSLPKNIKFKWMELFSRGG